MVWEDDRLLKVQRQHYAVHLVVERSRSCLVVRAKRIMGVCLYGRVSLDDVRSVGFCFSLPKEFEGVVEVALKGSDDSFSNPGSTSV